MSKKTSNTATTGDPIQTPENNISTLYTAHQVHTLAQILFRQIAVGWQSGAYWFSPAGAGLPQSREIPAYAMGGPAPNSAPQAPGTGMLQGTPPALFYWYP